MHSADEFAYALLALHKEGSGAHIGRAIIEALTSATCDPKIKVEIIHRSFAGFYTDELHALIAGTINGGKDIYLNDIEFPALGGYLDALLTRPEIIGQGMLFGAGRFHFTNARITFSADGVYLPAAVFRNARFASVRFRSANLHRADFTGANLDRSCFAPLEDTR